MKFKSLHPWDLSPPQAIKVQNKLKGKIKLKKWSGTLKLVAGADVAFKKGRALAAVVVVSYPEFKVIECVRKSTKISYPYIPGLLTFREGPVLEKCFKVLRNEPDVIIFDGQGIAHPRNMGLATHLGILLNKPSIGCAKTLLFGNYVEPPALRGAFSYLLDKQGKKIGAVLRTRDFTKPVYVSPGHKINLTSSIKIILLCTGKYRLPQPLRLAHHLTKHSKNLLPKLKFLL
jgi:deoxyribonuclease V